MLRVIHLSLHPSDSKSFQNCYQNHQIRMWNVQNPQWTKFKNQQEHTILKRFWHINQPKWSLHWRTTHWTALGDLRSVESRHLPTVKLPCHAFLSLHPSDSTHQRKHLVFSSTAMLSTILYSEIKIGWFLNHKMVAAVKKGSLNRILIYWKPNAN